MEMLFPFTSTPELSVDFLSSTLCLPFILLRHHFVLLAYHQSIYSLSPPGCLLGFFDLRLHLLRYCFLLHQTSPASSFPLTGDCHLKPGPPLTDFLLMLRLSSLASCIWVFLAACRYCWRVILWIFYLKELKSSF